MKLLNYLGAFAIAGLILSAVPACNNTATESCEQQDMNQILNCGVEKNVEVCCETGASCVYKYNGVEYADNDQGLNDLADALGCDYKSSEIEIQQKDIIIQQLIKLRDKAKIGTY